MDAASYVYSRVNLGLLYPKPRSMPTWRARYRGCTPEPLAVLAAFKTLEAVENPDSLPLGVKRLLDSLPLGVKRLLDEHCAQMQYESMRWRTFRDKWPAELFINAKDVAAAGFYYVGPRDRVRCFSCGILLENWAHLRTNEPFSLHEQTEHYCPFVLERLNKVDFDTPFDRELLVKKLQ